VHIRTNARVAKPEGSILKLARKADLGGYSGCFLDSDRHPWEIALEYLFSAQAVKFGFA
jgi:hypothetical protein